MSEHGHGTSTEDSAEGGALDDPGTASEELQQAQQGRGYREDEGERDDALDGAGEQ